MQHKGIVSLKVKQDDEVVAQATVAFLGAEAIVTDGFHYWVAADAAQAIRDAEAWVASAVAPYLGAEDVAVTAHVVRGGDAELGALTWAPRPADAMPAEVGAWALEFLQA